MKLWLSSLLLLAGCSFLPPQVTENLPEENYLVELGEKELFALRPDGEIVAYVNQGLYILRLADRSRQRITYDSPRALTWSPDGESLVVAIRGIEKTRLVQLTASKEELPQTLVDEDIIDFAWLADGNLLALGQQLEPAGEDSFDLQVNLLIWDGLWDVERIPLYRRTFPYRASEDAAPITHQFSLSPLKDELVYNRYLAPPGFASPMELVLYNLQTGTELPLLKTDIRHPDAVLTADAESILLPRGRERVEVLNLWTRNVKQSWSSPGRVLQAATDRELYFVDGKLYAGGQPLLSLPFASHAEFSADGSRLLVVGEGKLYLFGGYQLPDKIEFSDLEKLKLQRIRQQRSRAEINIREYYQRRNNILNP